MKTSDCRTRDLNNTKPRTLEKKKKVNFHYLSCQTASQLNQQRQPEGDSGEGQQ